MTGFTLSATDLAIRIAKREGTLRVSEHTGRFGQYWAISDSHGVIEVHDTAAEADARVAI